MSTTEFSTSLAHEHSRALVRAFSRELRDGSQPRDTLLRQYQGCKRELAQDDHATYDVCLCILADLSAQGWSLEVSGEEIALSPPPELQIDSKKSRDRIRDQEKLKRAEQLSTPSVRRFVVDMEKRRVHEGRFTSIFDLFREGRDLAAALSRAQARKDDERVAELENVFSPYLEFVDPKLHCRFTGLRLQDIWRYFRHTWTSQYSSIPGRTMAFLVRDAAAPNHPVIGIGALSSPVVQIESRDTAIGWLPNQIVSECKENPTPRLGRWLTKVIDDAISELYIQDFLEGEVGIPPLALDELAAPRKETVSRLKKWGHERRAAHEQSVVHSEHRVQGDRKLPETWEPITRTPLFQSKRALSLADYLEVRQTLNKFLSDSPTADEVRLLAESSDGRAAIKRVARKAKADSVGISLSDLTVCGAVPPYSHILGGKLVAMLATSQEVVEEYRRRYGTAVSEIASKMAGRPITRPAELAYIGTTSLYGRSSQYNRIAIPATALGTGGQCSIRYTPLAGRTDQDGGAAVSGRTKGVGTSHFSRDTLLAIDRMLQVHRAGIRVNNLFGEGSSPKVRKLREGISLAGFPSSVLRHHRRRQVYGVSLVENPRDFLLGMDQTPRYISRVSGRAASEKIATWWRSRWLSKRIDSDEILDSVSSHTLIAPVRHGARVELPPDPELLPFADQ